MKAFMLIFTALLIVGCRHAAPGVVADQPSAPRDPMYDLCMTTDFSHHTDQELHACGVWLGTRQPMNPVPAARPRTDPALSNKTYTIMTPNGQLRFMSCVDSTCMMIP